MVRKVSKRSKIKYGYVCSTSFEDEFRNSWPAIKIYPTIKEIKRCCECVRGTGITCGIYKIKLELIKVVKKWKI